MADIKIRQEKMKEKRKNTPFREFLKQIVSFRTLSLYKNGGYPSVYPDTDRIKGVIGLKDFENSRDDLAKSTFEYDFSLHFFENFKKFFGDIQQPCMRLFEECDNCGFADQIVASKNCYLSYVVIKDCENILYSLSVKENSNNIINSVLVRDNCEIVYFCTGIIKSFKVFYSKYIQNSSDIYFSSNLIGCHECLFCDNLENQSYCIYNKQLSKEEYAQKKSELLRQKDKFLERYHKLPNSGNNISSNNISGNFNIQCENIENGYCNYQLKDAKNVILVGGKDAATNMYDCFLNTPPLNDYYGTFSAGYGDNIYNSYHIKGGSNVYYSACLENSSYCLGCVGLRNKSFYIFNKEYSKEERFTLANKIFAQMDADGILGEFFPGYLNPFYFNDTAAYLIDDTFTKEEILKDGYLRRDEEIKVDVPTDAEVITIKKLSQYQGFDDTGEREINKDILKRVIKDEKGNYYRIVPMELDFLQKHGLPLPEIHWLERIKLGFKFT